MNHIIKVWHIRLIPVYGKGGSPLDLNNHLVCRTGLFKTCNCASSSMLLTQDVCTLNSLWDETGNRVNILTTWPREHPVTEGLGEGRLLMPMQNLVVKTCKNKLVKWYIRHPSPFFYLNLSQYMGPIKFRASNWILTDWLTEVKSAEERGRFKPLTFRFTLNHQTTMTFQGHLM